MSVNWCVSSVLYITCCWCCCFCELLNLSMKMLLLIYCVVQCLLVFHLQDIVLGVDVGLIDASIDVIVVAATFCSNTVGF